MNLNTLPKQIQEMIAELTTDEEFQKLFAEDKVLNELEEQGNKKEFDYRVCQLVVDYLITKGKIVPDGIIGKLLLKFFRELLITTMHRTK